jgi:hypothetical protein
MCHLPFVVSVASGLKNLLVENPIRPPSEVGQKCDSTKLLIVSLQPAVEKQSCIGAAYDFRSLTGRFPDQPVLIYLLVDLLSNGVRGICSAIAEYGIRVKDKAFSKD